MRRAVRFLPHLDGEAAPVWNFLRRRSGPAEVARQKRDGNTRTLQRSCHGANGQSGAEGQESSAPVWKINDGRATGEKDRQKR